MFVKKGKGEGDDEEAKKVRVKGGRIKEQLGQGASRHLLVVVPALTNRETENQGSMFAPEPEL